MECPRTRLRTALENRANVADATLAAAWEDVGHAVVRRFWDEESIWFYSLDPLHNLDVRIGSVMR